MKPNTVSDNEILENYTAIENSNLNSHYKS